MPLSQPGVSKHLKVLREAGLVDVRRDGKRRWLRRPRGALTEMGRLGCARFDALERHLKEHP
jgi:DNA-binding transcriptional ArsR family regulator